MARKIEPSSYPLNGPLRANSGDNVFAAVIRTDESVFRTGALTAVFSEIVDRPTPKARILFRVALDGF